MAHKVSPDDEPTEYDDDRSRKREFGLFEWADRWGRPPLIILIGHWVFLGGPSLLCFGAIAGIVLFWVPESQSAVESVTALVAALGVALFGYVCFWRPLWRTHAYFWQFDRTRKVRQIATLEHQGKSDHAPSELELRSLVPDSNHYHWAVAQCERSLAAQFQTRVLNPKELEQLQQHVQQMVRPAASGQIEIRDAFAVGNAPYTLRYAILTHAGSGRDSDSVRVEQIIALPLACDLGRLWMRPETTSDQVAELFVSRDLDVPSQPLFSGKYYLQAERQDVVTLRVPEAVWELLGKESDLVLVGSGPTLIVGRDGGIGPISAAKLVSLGFAIASAFDGEY